MTKSPNLLKTQTNNERNKKKTKQKETLGKSIRRKKKEIIKEQ
jgi:hypothetical protein